MAACAAESTRERSLFHIRGLSRYLLAVPHQLQPLPDALLVCTLCIIGRRIKLKKYKAALREYQEKYPETISDLQGGDLEAAQPSDDGSFVSGFL